MKFHLTNKKNDVAFGLIEVLVGIAVAGVIMLAIYGGMASSFQVMQLTREEMRATQIMLEKLEALRGSGWQLVTNTSCPMDWSKFTNSFSSDSADTNALQFYGSLSLSSPTFTSSGTTPAYMGDIKNITITVTWLDTLGGGRVRRQTRTMSTWVARQGFK